MSVRQLVRQIHAGRTRIVLALAGGARAIGQLLEVPGASRTVLQVVVPYSATAMNEWLGGPPEQACSAQNARAMAMAAFLEAGRLDDSQGPQAGIACTASLATDRPKRGRHRAHVALQTAAVTATRAIEFQKGARSRAQEERLVSRLVLNAVAEACGLKRRLRLELLEGEQTDQSTVEAPQAWQDLLLGKVEKVPHGGPAGRTPKALFPGAFNPVHAGHRRMAEIARKLLGEPIDFEISILNPDKPSLDYCEIERRIAQAPAGETVWITRLPTFEEKSRAFPGVTFVVGTDTLRRIADRRYYGNDAAACRAALDRIAARGCRFLVFGRDLGHGFVALGDLTLPDPLPSLCREVPQSQFREDVSSTEIRKRATDHCGDES
jgi:nicotinamide mononucleotide (NMN) deamidase PncC